MTRTTAAAALGLVMVAAAVHSGAGLRPLHPSRPPTHAPWPGAYGASRQQHRCGAGPSCSRTTTTATTPWAETVGLARGRSNGRYRLSPSCASPSAEEEAAGAGAGAVAGAAGAAAADGGDGGDKEAAAPTAYEVQRPITGVFDVFVKTR